jgi:hypothetical protein
MQHFGMVNHCCTVKKQASAAEAHLIQDRLLLIHVRVHLIQVRLVLIRIMVHLIQVRLHLS